MEIGSGATLNDIKKSFRRLAHEYHPDKNQSNVFAEARFREIHEAYTILADEGKRSLYDHERWLSGRFIKNAAIITPEYLLLEIQKLNSHIGSIDVYRMNKQLLHQYLLFMLTDEKVAILLRKGKIADISGIVEGMMKAAATLPHYFAKEVLVRLKTIAVHNPDDEYKVNNTLRQLARSEKWQKLFPWLTLIITLMICVAMYFFSKE